MKNKNNQNDNYLENVPKINPNLKTTTNYRGDIILLKENNSVFDKIVQKLFAKPKFTKIHLDKMGKFIWQQIDGKRNLIEIGVLFKEEFKEKAEPLYERLAMYFKMLEAQGFIIFE